MTWIEKELKRRASETRPATLQLPPMESASTRMLALWGHIERINASLPTELQLQPNKTAPFSSPFEGPKFRGWLCAPDGAALGFTGNAVRYAWPKSGPSRSNNFWIGWSGERNRYVLSQRMNTKIPPRLANYSLDEARVDYLVRCLVQGKLVPAKALRKKRLWLF